MLVQFLEAKLSSNPQIHRFAIEGSYLLESEPTYPIPVGTFEDDDFPKFPVWMLIPWTLLGSMLFNLDLFKVFFLLSTMVHHNENHPMGEYVLPFSKHQTSESKFKDQG